MSKNSGIGFRREGDATEQVSDPFDAEREFWLRIREARLIELAAIEERLGLERSRETRKERKNTVLSKPGAAVRVERVELTDAELRGLKTRAESIA